MRSNRPLSAGRKTHTFKILGRLLSYLFHYYKWRMIAVFVCITVAAAAGISSSVFLMLVLDKVITPLMRGVAWSAVAGDLALIIGGMGLMYVIALAASTFYNQTMAIVTQGFLQHIREDMFNHMESLPIRYFDTHTHGDVMSVYTPTIRTHCVSWSASAFRRSSTRASRPWCCSSSCSRTACG